MPRTEKVAGIVSISLLVALSSKVKPLRHTAHVFKVLTRIDHSSIACHTRANLFLDFAIGRLALWGSARTLTRGSQEVDEDYAFTNGISCAVNIVEGIQLLGNARLAFKAITIAIVVRVLA